MVIGRRLIIDHDVFIVAITVVVVVIVVSTVHDLYNG